MRRGAAGSSKKKGRNSHNSPAPHVPSSSLLRLRWRQRGRGEQAEVDSARTDRHQSPVRCRGQRRRSGAAPDPSNIPLRQHLHYSRGSRGRLAPKHNSLGLPLLRRRHSNQPPRIQMHPWMAWDETPSHPNPRKNP